MGGLHSGETGPSEMLMELVYRLATETSPLIKQIRENVIVSVTPQADPDGRDRNVDWFYRTQTISRRAGGRGARRAGARRRARPQVAVSGGSAGGGGGGGRGAAAVPYWGKYVYHDNNRDINLSQKSMRAIADWYFTAHPPIVHDLHESLSLMYTYSGAAPQNPESRSDPLRRAAVVLELRAVADDEVGHAGRLHACVHGRLVAGLPRIGRLQSQRHDADVRDAVGSRGRARRGAAAARWRARRQRAATPRAAGAGRGEARGRRHGETGAPPAAGRGEAEAMARRGTPMPAIAGRCRRPPAVARAAGPPTGRGGGQPREWYRGLPVPPGAAATSPAATTPTTCRPASSAPCSSPRRSRISWWTTSIRRRRTRSRRGRPSRRTAS